VIDYETFCKIYHCHDRHCLTIAQGGSILAWQSALRYRSQILLSRQVG